MLLLSLSFSPQHFSFPYLKKEKHFSTEHATVSERSRHAAFTPVVGPPSLPVRAQNTDVLFQEQAEAGGEEESEKKEEEEEEDEEEEEEEQ